jgi:flagellar biosynthesis/type III secretory pathway protein FliH
MRRTSAATSRPLVASPSSACAWWRPTSPTPLAKALEKARKRAEEQAEQARSEGYSSGSAAGSASGSATGYDAGLTDGSDDLTCSDDPDLHWLPACW